MAQYQNTEDIITRALKKAGEPTNGNSSYTESLTEYLSDVQRKLISGATLFDLDTDIAWPFARAEHPVVIELLPKYNTGTLSLTYGSNIGAFSSAPASSLTGWFIRSTSGEEAYRIAYHAAGDTAFSLETLFLGTTNALFAYEAYKLDYEILPQYLFVTGKNNKLIVSQDGTAQISVTITPGVYTPQGFASAWQTELNAQLTANITVTYDTISRLFTFTSDGGTFQILGERGSNLTSGMPLAGFDLLDYTGALSYTGSYPLGAVARIVEPVRFLSGRDSQEVLISGSDPLSYSQNYSVRRAQQGTPTALTKIGDDNTGKITLRFNNFPEFNSRVEVTVMPYPVDLQNNENSVPLLPPKYFNFLEYAGVYFLFLEKEDTKGQEYLALAQAELKAMRKQYAAEQFRTSGIFGYVAPRAMSFGPWYNRLRYGYDKDKY